MVRMTRRNLVLLSVVFCLVLGALLWWFIAGQGNEKRCLAPNDAYVDCDDLRQHPDWTGWPEPPPSSEPRTSGKYTLFEGTVKGISHGCDLDGQCSVTVDDKVVITGSGLGPKPEDNVFGSVASDLSVGEKVTVKALKADSEYSLQRCAECYVKRVGD